jgi:hypothetical protein
MRSPKADRFIMQSKPPDDLAAALGIRWFRIPDKLLAFLSFAAPAWNEAMA